jgi:hypothetical protein
VVNTGSVINTQRAVRMRKVEWPMNVTATCPGATDVGGGAWWLSGTLDGQATRWRVRIHRAISASERSALRYGLKNRSPLKWSEAG